VSDKNLRFVFLFALSVSMVACQQNKYNKNPIEDVNHIAQISQLHLPDDVELLFFGDDGRGKENQYIRRILYSTSKIDGQNYKGISVQSQAAYDGMRVSLKNMDIGIPEESVISSRWTNENGEWHGIFLKTTNGYYLQLEQFIKESDS